MHLRSALILSVISVLLICLSERIHADDKDGVGHLLSPLADTEQNYTTVGNIGLTITNFGTLGTGNAYWPQQPSCEYPTGSRIEHIYRAGLWVGAVSRESGQQLVSTGATDGQSSPTAREGYEFSSAFEATMGQRSSLSESQYFSENAISHQDFVAEYTDTYRTNPTTGDTIPNHTPMGITVRQESYAFNFPFADFFVILNYTVFNTGADTLDSVYVGLWNNAVVRNTNNVRPRATGYFGHGAYGWVDSLRLMYTFDFDGIPTPPAADSYVAAVLLGSTPFPNGVQSQDSLKTRTYFNAWTFGTSTGTEVYYFTPGGDAEVVNGARSRFDRLASSLPRTPVDRIAPLRLAASSKITLLSVGPFATLNPGDSLKVAIGIVCARKAGNDPARFDTPAQRSVMYVNAGFCQQAYNGEDVNGDNILQPEEDLNGNGKLDHFQLPQPPRSPKTRIAVENRNVALYWDKSTSELSLDPITREYDFEGYRVYRSNAGADFTNPEDLLLTLSLVGEFDRPGNGIGYNTGFSAIALSNPKIFPGDTVAYWYRFPPSGADVPHLNGWQYLYGVAAFDRGDSSRSIVSLSSKTEVRRAIPGASATSDRTTAIGVYPNPYYVNAVWDGAGERVRKMYFYNLPVRCEIRIYTLAGDVVADFEHDAATYNGTDIEWFRRFGSSETPLQFSGGEHAWDLVTKFDQAIATGLYLFSVKDSDTGDVKTGKFLVIK